ncbi:LysR family transcriptional regulator [Paraburkholderia caballeronis]|uniref:LysR family transcriptional regulator n=1 Tax=Paraburkholderia caballeronis TaxID=416943 RepID=UPI001066A94B|nr:LysR family transcriptional regulator [Paraburkholderia caballeronis]TDV07875.1 LysR family transcriptional regulator [Paraburkholderia caballeronis]TDV11238.1 LysR family transcriptional regulator [Paraburkholderia caballeronis]TDV21618.1 LysR family transcriptional regulator [Paraburkholderia caballeronis]
MDTLRNMRIFVRVVESGSFTRAAAHESMTTAQVSRAITDLESRLRTRLLNRTTRRMSLTEAGERYLQSCRRILADVEQAEAEAAAAHANPVGKLRVYGGTSFGQHYVMPLIARYQQHQPEVAVDLTIAQQMPDIIEEGFDVAVVIAAQLEDSALISQHLGSTAAILCASPEYLRTRGAPESFDDLDHHTCLHLTDASLPAGQWVSEGPHGETFRHTGVTPFQVNNPEALALAIREGMGIGPLPVPVALPGLTDGSLVRVLPTLRLQTLNIYALYASRRYLDAKIRTFVEFLRDSVPVTLAEQEEALSACNASLPGVVPHVRSRESREAERLRLVN